MYQTKYKADQHASSCPKLAKPTLGLWQYCSIEYCTGAELTLEVHVELPQPHLTLEMGQMEEVVGSEDHFGGEVLRNQTCLPIPHYLGFTSLTTLAEA